MQRLFITLCLVSLLQAAASAEEIPAPLDGRLEELRQRFPAADLNQDGTLTTGEFREFRNGLTSGSTVPLAPTGVIAPKETPATPPPSHTDPVEIRITSSKPVPINPGIYGINCAEMFIFDLVQKPEYLAALADLRLRTFLYPGGSSYHHPSGSGGFNVRAEELIRSKHGLDHRINKEGFPDFFQQYLGFMRPMGGHSVFVPNVPNGTVEELDWYMRKMTEAEVPVETVVLGMEVQLGAFRFESSADYIAKIEPYIELLRTKYPDVRIAGWSTPVGRRSTVPESYRQWNREVAKVSGIDGFAQYGWTEFASSARRGRISGESKSPDERLAEYDAFVRSFPAKQIEAYAGDWGADKKMFLLQWGTHADRNTVLEGLHSANFLFFMTEYNAAHDNYFEVATWSVPIMSDLSSGRRRGSGEGRVYEREIALWSSYLYVKPLRHFYGGDQSLLGATVSGVENHGPMEVVKVIACVGADGKKRLCILNRGPAIPLGRIEVDGEPVSPAAELSIESVSGDTLTAAGGSLKTFDGKKTLESVSIEPFSITTLTLP